MFSFSSIVELRGGPRSLAIRDHLGISPTRWRASVTSARPTAVVGIGLATAVLQST